MMIQLGLVIIVVATALLVFFRKPGVTGRSGLLLAGILTSLSFCFLAAAAHYRQQPPKAPPAHDPPREVVSDGYIGSASCRSCHPHEHATWHSSWHRTMTQVAKPESVMSNMDHVTIDWQNVRFRIERTGDEFWASSQPLATVGAIGPVNRQRWPIVLTTGSHHMQLYWMSRSDNSRRLLLFPFAWFGEQHRWVPRKSLFLHPPSNGIPIEVDRWAAECIQCHTTFGRLGVPPDGDLAWDHAKTRAVEFGISCEACHGPGEHHVEANRNPLRRYRQHLSSDGDTTIIQPERLSHNLSSQVCGQCHGLNHFRSGEAHLKWAQDGFDYRPGQDLSQSALRSLDRCCAGISTDSAIATELTELRNTQFWSDGMVRVSGREYNGLVESPCFQRGEMSCLSCHVLHQSTDDPRPAKEWANDQLKPRMVRGNDACLQCHDTLADESALQEHTHHPVSSSGSNCYNCHMSYTTYGLVKAIRSHQIDSPNVSSAQATGRPNACNQCHLNQTLAWTADRLSEWYKIEAPEVHGDEQAVAASILWLLRGDAGQRTLMAWSFGWPEAQQASGTDWMGPYLAHLLTDPYDTVRLIAARSLRSIAEFRSVEYDFVGLRKHQQQARLNVLERWQHTPGAELRREQPALLIGERGELMQDTFDRLSAERNDRPVSLTE